MSDLDALIAKLEAASEGSEALDWEIVQRVGHWNVIAGMTPYTRSLDAALTLVPEGWGWEVTGAGVAVICSDWHDDDADVYWGGAEPRRHTVVSGHRGHSTPALALCIAALKARRTDNE